MSGRVRVAEDVHEPAAETGGQVLLGSLECDLSRGVDGWILEGVGEGQQIELLEALRGVLGQVVLERRERGPPEALFQRPEQGKRRDAQRGDGRDDDRADDPSAQTERPSSRPRSRHLYGPRRRYPAPRTVRM